ncbi:muscle M-line assembly protein unc-89 isoform X2 [Drosophila subpulchrella]|uniref:muscle M-line assembly protein unc-89 isoform X2 n=1 Tax=Drosophila subpulchrella TaxID=1486046 RepID=UPI0018A14346|nr:muscle M-line assembly protein unc-89 isoform X2 [Drosophila subpulchrella]
MRRSKMAWSNNVRLFLKLSTQRCQFLSVGSKSEAPGGQKPGIFESDILASTSNARHMECLFAKWIRDKNSIHGTWQHFFKELVKEQVDTAMTTPKLYHPRPNDPNLSGKTDLYENLARHIHASSLSNQEMSFQEKAKYSTSNVGSMDNRSDKVNFSVPVTSPTISPPVLKDPSSTAKSDLNTCVVRPQKEDMEVLSLSTEIRTSGIYDHTKIGRKIPCFVLTAKGVADPFSKNMTRRMSQKKPPKEPVQSSLTAERSKRSKNRRNKFQKRYSSFETFLKYWKQASKREKFRRHNGPVMVVKKRSIGNSKPNNTMCFKSYYEKRPNQRKEKVPETISKQEIKVPSKPKEDKPKDQPELDPMKCNKTPLNASQVEDKDKDVKARDNASKTIETAKKSTMVSEESRNTRIPKNKSDTYETLEDLIEDIDDNTLNEDSIQPEKAKFVESASKKMPVEYKTSLRVFRPKENVKPKAVDQSLDVKQKPALKSKKPASNKPIPETFRPLRVFNADQKVIPKDEDKSWIYWDELTVKSLRKPTPDSKAKESKRNDEGFGQ